MAKKITKREKKALLKKNRLVFELSFLVPCFVYIMEQYNKSTKKLNDDVFQDKTKELLGVVGRKIDHYKEYHSEAISLFSQSIKEVDTTNINIFLFGLSMLGEHLEQKNNVITFELTDHLNDLIDDITSHLEQEVSNKTFFAAAEVKNILLKRHR